MGNSINKGAVVSSRDTLGAANDWLMGGWLKGRKKDEDKSMSGKLLEITFYAIVRTLCAS